MVLISEDEMYRHFLLNSGYVEDQTLAQVLLTKVDGTFASITDAIYTFVDGLAADQGFDNTNPDMVQDAIAKFLNGDMQTHGYFLFEYEWNTGNLLDLQEDELVVCIDRAPEVISDIYCGTIDQHYFKCMTRCIKIKATSDDHGPKL